MNMAEKHGPFDTYKEVATDRGTYGLQPGEVLVVSNKGVERIASDDKGADDAANAGSVKDVLARVGDDAEAAAEALDAEQAADTPRTSLVSGLEAVIAAAEEDEEDETE